MQKIDVVKTLLANNNRDANGRTGKAFAASNIALCKYWGKRDNILNLPMTSSLSVSLGDKGATAALSETAGSQDPIILNGKPVALESAFSQRLSAFLDLFRPTPATRYQVITDMNIPVAAGLASSACGFAALVLALNELYQWQLPATSLSILARLGSGSAARSIWQGFVEWHVGAQENGMDSFGELLNIQWPELRVGLHLLNTGHKPLSSREAMLRTVQTSTLYSAWPKQVAADMPALKQALLAHDFVSTGQIAENNALTMHATMQSAWPPVLYSQPETVAAMHKVWQLRGDGVPVYFTQDAGPNLKLLFLAESQADIDSAFPNLEVCAPW